MSPTVLEVWLDSCEIVYAHGFNPGELKSIRELVEENRETLQQAWDDYFREPPSGVR